MRRICRHAALLTALTVTSGACTYLAGDTCDDDACLPNHPPIAVISDVGQDGALRVGTAGEVLVSARDSNDPDGDVLAYLWYVGEPCAGAVVSELTVEDLRLDDLPVGSTCTVTLTVSDPRGKSDAAEATLVIRNVGGHVTNTGSGCIAIFNLDTEGPQGTASTPFCAIDQALIAASAYHLGEISLVSGNHAFVGRMLLDFPVTLRGGYLANPSEWLPGTGLVSTVVLSQAPTGASDAQVSVTSGVSASFVNLTVRRSGACRSDCVLVQATGANLAFDNVALGDSRLLDGAANANDAAGRVYTSILMSTTSDASVKTWMLSASSLTIYGSGNASSSSGIVMSGLVSAGLAGVVIHERAVSSIAVRLANALELIVSDSTFDVLTPGGVGSQAYGILDGNRKAVSPDKCDLSVHCDSSKNIAVQGGSITVTGADQVFGVDALGTSSVSLNTVTVLVDGQQAWGMLTSGAQEVSLTGVTVTATTRRIHGGPPTSATGISDNFAGKDEATEGSQRFQLSDTSASAIVVGTEVTQATALNLAYTTNVDVRGGSFAVRGNGPLASSVKSVAGIRLLSTRAVTVTDASILLSSLKAVDSVVGLYDGQPFRPAIQPSESAPYIASENVVARNVDVFTDVATELLTTAGCVIMSDTRGGAIIGARDAGAMSCGAGGAATAYGVALAETESFTVRDLNMVVSGGGTGVPVYNATYVGVQDGGFEVSDLDKASSSLTITGNRIGLSQVGGIQVGVRLRGATASSETTIDDNLITVVDSTRNIGVLLQNSHATVALNSMRLQGCSVGCSDAFAVGIYILHSEAYTSRFLGNVLGVMDAIEIEKRPAFVRHNFLSSGWNAEIGVVNANLFGDEDDSLESPFVSGIASDSTDVISPAGMASYTVANVPGNANSHASPAYCPDGVHGDPDGPQRYAADFLTERFGRDIDGDNRQNASLDAGADLIADTCP